MNLFGVHQVRWSILWSQFFKKDPLGQKLYLQYSCKVHHLLWCCVRELNLISLAGLALFVMYLRDFREGGPHGVNDGWFSSNRPAVFPRGMSPLMKRNLNYPEQCNRNASDSILKSCSIKMKELDILLEWPPSKVTLFLLYSFPLFGVNLFHFW